MWGRGKRHHPYDCLRNAYRSITKRLGPPSSHGDGRNISEYSRNKSFRCTGVYNCNHHDWDMLHKDAQRDPEPSSRPFGPTVDFTLPSDCCLMMNHLQRTAHALSSVVHSDKQGFTEQQSDRPVSSSDTANFMAP